MFDNLSFILQYLAAVNNIYIWLTTYSENADEDSSGLFIPQFSLSGHFPIGDLLPGL